MQSVGPLKAPYTCCPPSQTCSFRHQLCFSWKHTGHAAIMRNDYITHISIIVYIARHLYSFIQLIQLGRASMDRTKMPNLRNCSKGGFEPMQAHLILRVRHFTAQSYRAPHNKSNKTVHGRINERRKYS